jgi:hypothetical protein
LESCPAIDKGPGVGRIAQQARERRSRRPSPDDRSIIAAALAAWEQQLSGGELTDDTVDRFYPKECAEDEIDPFANFLVGMLDEATGQITDQSDWKALGQVTTPGLIEQSSGQSRFDRMELQLGDLAF